MKSVTFAKFGFYVSSRKGKDFIEFTEAHINKSDSRALKCKKIMEYFDTDEVSFTN